MNYQKSLSVIIFILGASSSFAQMETNLTPDESYHKALSLYNRDLFKASQYWFEKAREESKEIVPRGRYTYYMAASAIKNGDEDAERMMETFIKEYPASPLANYAALDVADFYFSKGNYNKALQWYNKIHPYDVSWTQKDKYNFQKGYALFATEKIKESQKYFEDVRNSEEFGKHATYYLGYIAYDSDDYKKATEYFDRIESNQEVSKNISYYQADMNFKQGNFEKAIKEGLQQLDKRPSPLEKSEINKIIGESYFNLKQYKEAIPYLKKYNGKRGKLSNTDYYYLGYAYYKQNNYSEAINQFNKIVSGRNEVAQNAYYHLAECYLKTERKQEALNAFRNASQMEFNAEIKKDAFLNYARLSYEIGNPYESVPEVLQNYLINYPESNTEEINNLLVSSYVTSKNYPSALALLEKSSDKKSKKIYQQVAFYRGLELYNENQYKEALSFFKKAQQDYDATIRARATYWLAESEYQIKDLSAGLSDYLNFVRQPISKSTYEYKKGLYGLGYTYFNLKNYNNAIEYFEKYIAQRPALEDRVSDAYLRIADAYFAENKYWPAMESYNKVIESNSPDIDYASFQKAISYGFVDRVSRKIEELDAFITKFPKSNLRQNAIYELGNTYIAEGNNDKGVEMYNKIQNEYQNSSFVPRAMLREGLVYYNKGESQRALQLFKKIATDYPNSTEAMQAVNTVKLIYIDLGQVDRYATWVKGLDYVKTTDSELDNASYESAERQYAQQNQEASIRGFESYLREFPNGMHALQSEFSLAQLYFAKGEKEKALPLYEKVTQRNQNEYTEPALVRLSQMYIEKNQDSKAISTLKELEKISTITQNIIYAQSNLMKLNYDDKNYPLAITYAEKVLKEKSTDNRIKADAHSILARSYTQTGNETKAKAAYENVLKVATGSLAAEAMYYKAYFQNKEEKYKLSNQTIQQLAKEYGGYKEFSAKGLVLMAKNFDAMGDAYQAGYILESVIENFKEYPDVVKEATQELQKVKSKASQNNSSVNIQ